MTQNTEQKVRTRDEQAAALAKAIGPEKIYELLSSDYRAEIDERALQHISEAEARGAAEQRRKDAEGQEPASWQAFCPHVRQWLDVGKDYVHHYQKMGQEVRPLYTRSANVAALEARVKELERENARLKTAQFFGHDEAEGGSDDISTFFDDHEPGTILEIDGYRHVNTKWVFWDGNSPHVFDTEDEASAALKREGGE